MECDQPAVVTARQAQGDVEYLFATNAMPDESANAPLAIKSTVAKLWVIDDGRPIYDAVRGNEATEFSKTEGRRTAEVRFGPGQMRVFARTARPIGAVQVASPIVTRDYTVADNPLHVTVTAMVNDAAGKVLCGSIPLQLKVIDPLGDVRFDLYRATEQGICRIDLPLAANDPPGDWRRQRAANCSTNPKAPRVSP